MREFVVDRNGTRAAIAAGYSATSAHTTAHRLLKNADVRALIEKLESERLERLDITADRILQETAKLAFANMDDFVVRQDDGSAYVDLSEVKRNHMAAVVEITVDEYTEGRGEEKRNVRRTRFKLADKRAALEMLGRNHKLWTDRLEVKDGLNLEDLSDEQLQQLANRLQKGETARA